MTALVEQLRSRTDDMVAALRLLVETESPSSDNEAVTRCAEVVADLGSRLHPAVESLGGSPVVRMGSAEPAVLLLGHYDTVWPRGTAARWPFALDGDRATGPGIFDMKAGIVQGMFALDALGAPDGATLLLTGDEEIGSPRSRHLIEDVARSARAVLVLEPSADGALKIARKGVSRYDIEVTGRAAHSGLEPEKGANALVELCHQVLALGPLARPELGTTVTPTLAAAGTAMNTVPAVAGFTVDVRAAVGAEQTRVDEEIRRVRTVVPGTNVVVTGGPNRPPFEPSAAEALYADARRLAGELGLAPVGSAAVGGGSDGNFTAAMGIPTLDGLGAVGDGAHAEGEWVSVSAMPERAALVAALVRAILETR